MPGNFTDAKNMSNIIRKIYEEDFGGKKRGRYLLSRSQFRKLAKRKRLSDSFFNEVAEEALESGFILIPLGDSIAVIEEGVVSSYRPVTKKILDSFAIEKDADNDDKDDDKEDE
jgi:hypothetical protein